MNKHDTRNRIRLAVCEILAGVYFWTAYDMRLMPTAIIMGVIGLVFAVGGIVGFQDRT